MQPLLLKIIGEENFIFFSHSFGQVKSSAGRGRIPKWRRQMGKLKFANVSDLQAFFKGEGSVSHRSELS